MRILQLKLRIAEKLAVQQTLTFTAAILLSLYTVTAYAEVGGPSDSLGNAKLGYGVTAVPR